MENGTSNGSSKKSNHVNGSRSNPTEIIVVRHAERVDRVFPNWIEDCFDKNGTYRPRDLNLPKSVIERKGGPNDYLHDCPVTEMGYKQALLTGEGMRRLGLQISAAYTSPSLRSVQTCAAILEGLGQEELAIRVEPGQYDFWGSDRNEPVFLSTEELVKAGVKIDLNYEPFMTVEELFSYKQETLTECYERVDRVTRNALNNTTGSILIVGHMSSIGMCTCMLEERQPIGDKDVPRFIGLMSYCGAAITRQNEDGSWALVDPQPLLPLTHSGNNTFDPIGLYTVIEQNGS